MKTRKYHLLLIAFVFLLGCETNERKIAYNYDFIRSRNVQCTTTPQRSLAGFVDFGFGQPELKINHPRYLAAGESTDLPLIKDNDNRIPAGSLAGDTLNLELEVHWGDFRMETPDRPGLKMVALGEKGKAPSIPAPLVRTNEGNFIRARVTNTLSDSTITVFGLQERPFKEKDSIHVQPGQSKEVLFKAGEPGTYMYWARLGQGPPNEGFFSEEEEQLAGAFIIDPESGSPEDRVFVINVFSNKNRVEEPSPEWVESLTINGKSWPFTEIQEPAVGDTLNWRVVNASRRNHPMHLHGFYFNVHERGEVGKTKIYEKGQIPTVVTETLKRRQTMNMQWTPSRPGNWLFHCHLSFHVNAFSRLPGADQLDPEGSHQHMAGLVLGIKIKNDGYDLISKGPSKDLTMFALQNDEQLSVGLDEKDASSDFHPGPPLILKQYQTTNITVKNRMKEPTSIHWHGLEIDSWSDGVPNWSASDGRMSPVIDPGEEFTYKLSLMRPGTFVYHSHLDDIKQLTHGIYGAMIVIGEDDTYNPELDHYYMMGWKNGFPEKPEHLDLNGWKEIPVQKAKIGDSHRLRMINIAPAGNGRISMTKDGAVIPLKMLARDGAEFPAEQQRFVEKTAKLYVGETADVEFTPTEPGTYQLKVQYLMAEWIQEWVVE